MRLLVIVTILFAVGVFVSIQYLPRYGPPETPEPQNNPKGGLQDPSPDIHVGMALTVGGNDDASFNDIALRGLERARDELGITFQVMELSTDLAVQDALQQLAAQGASLIMTMGFAAEESIRAVAAEHLDKHFAMIDGVVEAENVVSLVFQEHEGSFLAGALAALVTQSQVLGFVGGADVSLNQRFQIGYEEGVQYIDPNITVLVDYVGSQPEAFDNPDRGEKLAAQQFDQGADIIYQAAGGSGLGVIREAKERGRFAIGTDWNQDHLAPGFVLTSVLKRVDVAIYETILDVTEGRSPSGVRHFGVAEGGVGLTDYQFTRDKIPDDAVNTVDAIRDKIASGQIEVPHAREETLQRP